MDKHISEYLLNKKCPKHEVLDFVNTTFKDTKLFIDPVLIEVGFGRINKPKYCWCKKGIRPSVSCYHIREYRYAYGAVEPATRESCFLVMPYCNTDCINVFLAHLSKSYPDDRVILVCDGAAWHKAKSLIVPENISIVFIPPYTSEMNPIEQIWKKIRKIGFKNEIF